jgi:hypothetical protein
VQHITVATAASLCWKYIICLLKRALLKIFFADAIFGCSYDTNYINEFQAFGKNLSGVKRFMIRTTDECN